MPIALEFSTHFIFLFVAVVSEDTFTLASTYTTIYIWDIWILYGQNLLQFQINDCGEPRLKKTELARGTIKIKDHSHSTSTLIAEDAVENIFSLDFLHQSVSDRLVGQGDILSNKTLVGARCSYRLQGDDLLVYVCRVATRLLRFYALSSGIRTLH